MRERLLAGLLEDAEVRLLDSACWSLPVSEVEITYETVRRSKMDVLMKMLLLSFQRLELSDAQEVSDILMVEPLFVQDLIGKMISTGMIEKGKNLYRVTGKGEELLESGIFVHPPEQAKRIAYYSAAHHQFFPEIDETALKPASAAEKIYRHMPSGKKDVSSLDESVIEKFLIGTITENGPGEEEPLQVEIGKITEVAELQEAEVPCYEFQLHHAGSGRKYVRVWNTLSGQWDEIVEKQIFDRQA